MPKRGPHHANITWLPHLRVAWGGTIGSTKEIWTNSIKFLFDVVDFVPTEEMLTAADASTYNSLSSWVATTNPLSSSFIGNDARLTWLKMNPITAQGLQFRSNTHHYDAPDGGQNGGNLNFIPFNQTFALTLRTPIRRGRAHSGRIFPPLVEPDITAATGMISVADATSMAESFGQCLLKMRDTIVAACGAGHFAVLSPGDTTKGTVPISAPIIGVVADRVPDVQHRRTNKLPRSEGATKVIV